MSDRLDRADFVREALVSEISAMLDELGNPPLVERIFPNGWRTAPDDGLRNLYDLCIRTYRARASTSDAPLSIGEGDRG